MTSTLDRAITFFRRHRTEQFQCEARVTRAGGAPVFDPNTGTITPPAPTDVYEGPCNVREMTWQGTDVRTGEREVRTYRAVFLFPHDTEILKDDIVTVTVSEHDAALVGQDYRIIDVLLDAWQTVRQAIGEKISGG